MRIVKIIILAILGLLSLAAGAAKLMKAPQETTFFDSLGIDLTFMLLLGLSQVIGGIFIIAPKLRKIGAIVVAIAFSISTIMISMAGQVGFVLFSLLPVLLALYIAISSQKMTRAKNT